MPDLTLERQIDVSLNENYEQHRQLLLDLFHGDEERLASYIADHTGTAIKVSGSIELLMYARDLFTILYGGIHLGIAMAQMMQEAESKARDV